MPEHLAKIGMSQAEFARRIEVSESYVTKIIQNKKHFSYPKAKRASDVLGCSIEELNEWE